MADLVPISTLIQLKQLGKYDAVLSFLDDYAAVGSLNGELLDLMTSCLQNTARLSDAISAQQMSIMIFGETYTKLVRLSDLLRQVEDYEGAIAAADRAIEIGEAPVEALVSRSLSLTSMSDYICGFQAAKTALDIDPGSAKALYGCALSSSFMGEIKKARELYTQSIAANPSWALPRLERSLIDLSAGNYDEGVVDYENRWLIDGAPKRRYQDYDVWDGEAFDGVLLLWAEQGIGDEIFFMRFIANLLLIQPHLAIEVDARLVKIVSRSFPGVCVIPRGHQNLLPFDQIKALPMGSLLKIFWERGLPLPLMSSGYLKPPSIPWSFSRSNDDSCSVGLFWRSERVRLGNFKSVSLEVLRPIFEAHHLDVIMLQYGDALKEVDNHSFVDQARLYRLPFDARSEIDYLASIIASCNIVVSVPGVAAHLANAMGVQLYVLSGNRQGRLWYWNSLDNDGVSRWFGNSFIYLRNNSQDLKADVSNIVKKITLLRNSGEARR